MKFLKSNSTAGTEATEERTLNQIADTTPTKIRRALLKISLAVILGVSGCNSTDKSTYGGFEYWRFSGLKHHHKTHPDDQGFLSGDAGSTEIKNGYFFNLSVNKDFGNNKINPYGTLGFLLGYAEDRKKNENDNRPDSSCSKIYSKIFPIAPQAGIGLETSLNEDTKLGVEATGTIFWIEHGWDRWGEDEASDHETKLFYNIGPVLKIHSSPYSETKIKWAIGNGGWVASIGLCF